MGAAIADHDTDVLARHRDLAVAQFDTHAVGHQRQARIHAHGNPQPQGLPEHRRALHLPQRHGLRGDGREAEPQRRGSREAQARRGAWSGAFQAFGGPMIEGLHGCSVDE